MKSFLFILLMLFSGLIQADNYFCTNGQDSRTETYEGFDVKFCFATAEYMKTFSLRLFDAKIPYVVYESGHIGYRSTDAPKVQKIGDKLTLEYINKKSEAKCNSL